jgi:Rieske 2Fe-2S family protein
MPEVGGTGILVQYPPSVPMIDFEQHPPFAAALARTTEPLEGARTLPAACYLSEAVLQCERETLFGRHWLAIGRETDLPEAGSFITAEIAAERVLVVRAEDGALHAFYNVCRHRGARLVEAASGRFRAAIVCPYHAWAYTFDGRLRGAPDMPAARTAEGCDLVAAGLGQRDGFVFVNLDPHSLPLGSALADLPDLARFGLQHLQRGGALDYRVEANWKLVCENYSECYHCARTHPQLDRLCELSSGGFEVGACFNGGPMQLRSGFDTLSMSGRSRWPLLAPDAAAGDDRLVHYYLLYPNLMLGVHPDYLAVHTVWPLSVGACRVRCEILVPPATAASADFDAAEVVEFWDLTNRQDWALCERVQRGAASRGYRPGPFHASERCLHAFDRWYAQWLLGAAA